LGTDWFEWHAVDRAVGNVRSLGPRKAEPIGVTQKKRHELNRWNIQLTDNAVFMVFWMERADNGKMAPRSQEFGAEDMSGGLALMEALRTRQMNGAEARHITMSSENPDSVGRRGVDVVGVGYSWTKRRRNERPKRSSDQRHGQMCCAPGKRRRSESGPDIFSSELRPSPRKDQGHVCRSDTGSAQMAIAIRYC
jgi:hypothetical protein